MTSYAVDLLYDHSPILAKDQLLHHLGPVSPYAVTVRAGRKPGSLRFQFSAYARNGASEAINFAANAPQVLMAVTDEPLAYDKLRPAIQQTWDWPEAAAIVAEHKATVLITDFHAEQLRYQARLELIHHCVAAVLGLAPCLALHWQASQHLFPPDRYLAERQANPDPLLAALHVRHFAGQDPLVPETVSDTLGLAALGQPDVECHYTGIDQAAMTPILQRIAHNIFAAGGPQSLDQTLQGLTEQPTWRWRTRLALTPPVREVVALDPGPPFAVH